MLCQFLGCLQTNIQNINSECRDEDVVLKNKESELESSVYEDHEYGNLYNQVQWSLITIQNIRYVLKYFFLSRNRKTFSKRPGSK